MTRDEQIAKDLEAALDLMNDEGRHWIQGKAKSDLPLDDGKHGFCSLGAIYQATGGWDTPSGTQARRYSGAAEALTRTLDGDLVSFWNDNPYRTWEDVKTAFQKTIKRLRKS